MERSDVRRSPAPESRLDAVSDGRVKLPPRYRLIDRLIEETGGSSNLQRLTLLRAPTGYGKTRTIVDWLGNGDDPDDHVRWVRAKPAAGEAIWQELAQAIAPFSTALPSERFAPEDVAHLASHLVDHLTLIIDDYHHATGPANDMALADLAASSSNLMLVVIARRVALLDGPMVSARIRVRVAGPEDLALTDAEMTQLAASFGVPQSENLREAFVQSAGWPLAVRAALALGSDTLYAEAASARTTIRQEIDAVANLRAFAVGALELLTLEQRRLLLAAALLDAISLEQSGRELGLDRDQTLAAAHHLIELGLLTSSTVDGMLEFQCHASVKQPLHTHATRTLDASETRELYRVRGDEIVGRAPFTAFKLYCASERFDEAEIVLARNFTLITDETEECLKVLRWIPEQVLATHPTFTAGLLLLELPRTSVAPTTLGYLGELWQQGLLARLPQGIHTPPGPIHLPLLCQSMVAARLGGRLQESHALMLHLESRLTSAYEEDRMSDPLGASISTSVAALTTSFPTYFREAAATSLMVGDYPRARRNLERLRRHSERRIARPWRGFPPASTRKISDPESGQRWLLTALGESAFTELLDGDMRRCAELLTQADALAASSGASAPGISWFGSEIARAHLAFELQDESLLRQAANRLLPYADRLEQWPLLMIAETSMVRIERGNDWALTQLTARLTAIDPALRVRSRWTDALTCYQAMLCAALGDLARAAETLAPLAAESPITRLELARLALYSGEDVGALISAQSIGDAVLTKRQLLDRCLISAVSAWACGRIDDAFDALRRAAGQLETQGTYSSMWGVPYDMLHEIAVEAREQGVCDIVELVEGVPEPVRSRRYERLTEMELRTLAAIAEHLNANRAAASLFVTQATVKKHLASVYRKLRAKNRDEAILVATRMGLLGDAR